MNSFPLNSRFKKKISLVFIFFVFLCGFVFPYKIKTSLDKNKCTVGDVLKFKLTLFHNKDELVDFYKRKGEFSNIYIRDIKVLKFKDRTEVIYEIQPFFLGERKIPLLPIKINGMEIGYSTPLVSIKSLTDKKNRPKSLKGPYEVTVSRGYTGFLFSGGVLIFIILSIFYIYRKKRGTPEVVKEDFPLINGENEGETFSNLLNKIEGLRKSKLYEKDGRYFAFLLNKLIRDILGLHFSENFLIYTNYEVVEFLNSLEIDVNEDLKWLLKSCEIVEFSPKYFNSDFYERMLNVSYKIAKYFKEKNE